MGNDFLGAAAWLTGGHEADRIRLNNDVKQSLDSLVRRVDEFYTNKGDVNCRLRELKSALSALERAMDNRVRELQQSAGRPSGFSSYSYAENDIKSERRKIDGLIEKISRDCNNLYDTHQQLKSECEDVRTKFKRMLQSNNSLLASLKPMVLGMSALSGASKDDRDAECREDDAKVKEVKMSCERKIAEITEFYENKLALLNASEDKLTDLHQMHALLEDEKKKTKLLTEELSREKQRLENYKKKLKRRSMAFLMVKVLNHTKRFMIKWYLWIMIVLIVICFVIIVRGLFF